MNFKGEKKIFDQSYSFISFFLNSLVISCSIFFHTHAIIKTFIFILFCLLSLYIIINFFLFLNRRYIHFHLLDAYIRKWKDDKIIFFINIIFCRCTSPRKNFMTKNPIGKILQLFIDEILKWCVKMREENLKEKIV